MNKNKLLRIKDFIIPCTVEAKRRQKQKVKPLPYTVWRKAYKDLLCNPLTNLQNQKQFTFSQMSYLSSYKWCLLRSSYKCIAYSKLYISKKEKSLYPTCSYIRACKACTAYPNPMYCRFFYSPFAVRPTAHLQAKLVTYKRSLYSVRHGHQELGSLYFGVHVMALPKGIKSKICTQSATLARARARARAQRAWAWAWASQIEDLMPLGKAIMCTASKAELYKSYLPKIYNPMRERGTAQAKIGAGKKKIKKLERRGLVHNCLTSKAKTSIFWYSKSKSSYTIVRPLLNFLRCNITMTCIWNFLPVYPDLSNLKMQYSRNRIRKQIVPTIKVFLNPKMEKALFGFSESYNLKTKKKR